MCSSCSQLNKVRPSSLSSSGAWWHGTTSVSVASSSIYSNFLRGIISNFRSELDANRAEQSARDHWLPRYYFVISYQSQSTLFPDMSEVSIFVYVSRSVSPLNWFVHWLNDVRLNVGWLLPLDPPVVALPAINDLQLSDGDTCKEVGQLEPVSSH